MGFRPRIVAKMRVLPKPSPVELALNKNRAGCDK